MVEVVKGSKKGCLLNEVPMSTNGHRQKLDMNFERTQSSRVHQLLDIVWVIFKQI